MKPQSRPGAAVRLITHHLSLTTAFLIYFERGTTQYRTVLLEAPAVGSVLSLGHLDRLELDAET